MAGGLGRALSGDNIYNNTCGQRVPRRGSSYCREGKRWDVELAEGHSGLLSAQRVRTEIRQMLRSPEMQRQ